MSKKIYLDYQATTPVDPKILKKMLPFFSKNFANPHSNNHQDGRLANEVIEEARESLKKISGEEIIFIRNASDNGQLYGSVSPKDISSYFDQKKIDIKPSNINLHSAIKKVGIYSINIKLHAEVTCDLKINVATSLESANEQKNELNKSNKPSEDIKNEESKVPVDDEINALKKNVVKSKTNKPSDEKSIAKTKSDVLIAVSRLSTFLPP